MILLERTVLDRPLRVAAERLNEGLWAAVTGGDRSHIGAISWAEPGGAGETKVFPGHKDHFITEPWARRLSDYVNSRVLVTCGIHYDGATPEDIDGILAAAEALLEELLQKL